MEHHWLLPPPGVVKVNVHGATQFIPFMNGNEHGIGMIIRNSEGEFLKLSTGVLPTSSSLENKLRAIHHGLIKAFDDNYKEVILETDNKEAFLIIKNFPFGVPPEVAEVAQQIYIRLNDPRWKCVMAYVFSGRNGAAIYLARLGAERCTQLFTLTRPVGAIEELLSLDLGFGRINPHLQDVEIFSDEEDPVDFGPTQLQDPGTIHGGYAFHEDFSALDNESTNGPVVLPIHEVEVEEVVQSNGRTAYP